MAGLELHRLGAKIGNVDGVGPEIIAVARRRPLGNKAGRHRDLDLAGYGAVHLNALLFMRRLGWHFVSGSADYGRKTIERKAIHGQGVDRTRSAA